MNKNVILPPEHAVSAAFDVAYNKLDTIQIDIEHVLGVLPHDAKYALWQDPALFVSIKDVVKRARVASDLATVCATVPQRFINEKLGGWYAVVIHDFKFIIVGWDV